ncbi:flagella basal body P-ring formation protein FlgA [Desulfovibrio sp. X2]|uniref:flagellar basal body P-ring formation chaperone FlgA n=1 Tax=Desulfovibrio sp. X2 TaxID=941449 RepID=UPI000358F16B|nr:flagellar basal body P-ring formation chaperone FlgA [Desulfovibrio sp. X2]EPR41702.1 flagella basal body P-ring formation protein FlgA [Desulfovibrio sp. X2]
MRLSAVAAVLLALFAALLAWPAPRVFSASPAPLVLPEPPPRATPQGLMPATPPATTPQGRSWTIVVRPAATAHGPKVLVGDVADVYGDLPQQTWDKIKAMALCSSPDRGRQVVLNPDQVRALFAAALGDDMARGVSVRTSLAVQRGGFVVSGEELRKLVVAFLTERTKGMAGEVKVRDIAVPDVLFLPDDFARMGVEQPRQIAPGKISLRLDALTADSRVLRSVAAGAFLDQWVAVPCAARPINTGDVITPDMVVSERKNAAYLKDEPVRVRPGIRAKRPIGQGLAITRDDVAEVPDVVKGATVQLLYRGTNVQLSINAQAMADGSLGEVIPVRNLQSGREVRAVVEGENTVVVR